MSNIINNNNNLEHLEKEKIVTSEEISKNYKKVLERIKLHCQKVRRDCDSIKVVAVTKTFPTEVILEAYKAGLRIFGENYAQELRDKSKLINFPDIEWHYIGRIQTNKLKYIVPIASLIHSVYRIEEIEEIDRLAKKYSKIQDILIEVNVSGEDTKGGVSIDNLENLLNISKRFENVRVTGLMTMAPFIEPEETRKYFKMLHELKEKLSHTFPHLHELSMGMSNDYHIAVEEGSTIVRIGTAIFGERG
ncbi:MAG: YggS family pyridoxal phosphate-dependent enzyme [Fervidobacterium sp.]